MKPIDKDQLPDSLKKIEKIKHWYKASEYENYMYLDSADEWFADLDAFEEWEYDQEIDDSDEIIWLYGSNRSYFSAPSAEALFAEMIDDDTFEEAWDRVKEECKEELIVIESAIECLAKKMEKLNIIGYSINYKIGVIPDRLLNAAANKLRVFTNT